MTQEDFIKNLETYNQEHIVQFMNELSEDNKSNLITEIKNIDFSHLIDAFQKSKFEKNSVEKLDSSMSPLPDDIKGSFEKSTPEQLNHYMMKGLKAIADGEVAVLLLAGGQGTRLGVNYPKGMFSVGLPSNKTLFQLQAERLISIQRIAAKHYSYEKQNIPWYIMTSENTQELIRDYFQKNNFFNLNQENIKFFEQGTLPCFSHDGKILLDQKHKISKSPDGNGGLYKALVKWNILDDMAKRGIKYIHVYCVDNILIKIADPTFIGFCIEKQSDCAAKVVKKIEPEENVGVICKVNDHFQVVEYSEISKETRNLRYDNNDLVYNAGNICNHFFTFEFLNTFCKTNENNLKYHVAEKKISYVDSEGMIRKPVSKNGIKLEKFIFDIFYFSKRFAVWEVIRRDEFSALKNSLDELTDNPVTCHNHIIEQHQRWLRDAGAIIENSDENNENGNYNSNDVEISPLISYSGEGLEWFAGKKLITPLILEQEKTSQIINFNGLDYITYRIKNNLI